MEFENIGVTEFNLAHHWLPRKQHLFGDPLDIVMLLATLPQQHGLNKEVATNNAHRFRYSVCRHVTSVYGHHQVYLRELFCHLQCISSGLLVRCLTVFHLLKVMVKKVL